MVTVNVFNRQRKVAISIPQVQKIVSYLLKRARKPCDEVALSFVSKQEIGKLHGTFFNDLSPTDCITFPCDAPGEGGYTVLGEAFICPEVALEYTTKKKGDVYREITLYIVHTLLHLLGHDDIEINARRRMRAAERRWMSYLDEASLSLRQ